MRIADGTGWMNNASQRKVKQNKKSKNSVVISTIVFTNLFFFKRFFYFFKVGQKANICTYLRRKKN